MSRVRENLSDRLTLERLRLEAKRSRRPVLVILIGAAIGLACWGYVLAKVGVNPLTDRQTVAFQVTTARAVTPSSNEVTIKGVLAGRVTDVQLRDGVAVITAAFDSQYGKIYPEREGPPAPEHGPARHGARRGRPRRSVRGAGRRKAPALASADRDLGRRRRRAEHARPGCPGERCDAPARPRLRHGGRRREASGGLRRARASVALVDRVATQIARRQAQTKRLISTTATLTQELGRRETALRRLVHEGGKTLRTLEAGGGDLDRVLAGLPAVLAAMETSFATVRNVLPAVDSAVATLRPAARKLPGGLSAARSLARAARPAVAALEEPVDRLRPLARELPPLSANLDGALSALRAADRCRRPRRRRTGSLHQEQGGAELLPVDAVGREVRGQPRRDDPRRYHRQLRQRHRGAGAQPEPRCAVLCHHHAESGDPVKAVGRHLLTLVCALLALGVFCLWLFWSGSLPGTGETYEVRATVPSAITVSAGANVRIAGVSVGRVDDVKLDGQAVALRLRMDTDNGGLPVDSRVGIRLRSLVGENYVEIVPGSRAQTIPDGGSVPAEQTNDYVEIDQILSVLKGKTRERARTLLQGASARPSGPGAARSTTSSAAPRASSTRARTSLRCWTATGSLSPAWSTTSVS